MGENDPMSWLLALLSYVFVQTLGLAIAYAAAGVFIYLILRRMHSRMMTMVLVAFFLGISLFVYAPRSSSCDRMRSGRIAENIVQ